MGTAINNVVANCFADYTLLGDDKGGAGGGVYNKGTFVGGLVYNCTSFMEVEYLPMVVKS